MATQLEPGTPLISVALSLRVAAAQPGLLMIHCDRFAILTPQVLRTNGNMRLGDCHIPKYEASVSHEARSASALVKLQVGLLPQVKSGAHCCWARRTSRGSARDEICSGIDGAVREQGATDLSRSS